ncbi:MAG: alpha/beta fold hydrolase [Candidatus Eremiobacteraeota bacterium]|nr:alpha/beta fold hydrolase [Candidatus Eremiobacteraeota bacterium]MBC5827092.1 alpha/beta fold hydrolase [Candidatus Eremiobacteraeota bacterium]
MNRAHGLLAAMDGSQIPYRAWGKAEAQSCLVLLHGGGPYSRWYETMGNALARLGVAVLAFDQRGFGETAGRRGDVARFSLYLDDCAIALSAATARWPDASLSLVGHSFGALVALRYCLDRMKRRGPAPAALLLIAPWIKDTLRLSARLVAAALVDSLIRPTKAYDVPLSVYDTADVSNDAALAECDRDPLCVHKLTARWYFATRRAKVGLMRQVRRLSLPVLQIEGTADTLIDADTNRRLFENIGSRRKRFVMMDGVYHDAQLQRDVSPVAGVMADFLEACEAQGAM